MTKQLMAGGEPKAFLRTSREKQLNVVKHATKAQEELHWLFEGGVKEGGSEEANPVLKSAAKKNHCSPCGNQQLCLVP